MTTAAASKENPKSRIELQLQQPGSNSWLPVAGNVELTPLPNATREHEISQGANAPMIQYMK